MYFISAYKSSYQLSSARSELAARAVINRRGFSLPSECECQDGLMEDLRSADYCEGKGNSFMCFFLMFYRHKISDRQTYRNHRTMQISLYFFFGVLSKLLKRTEVIPFNESRYYTNSFFSQKQRIFNRQLSYFYQT